MENVTYIAIQKPEWERLMSRIESLEKILLLLDTSTDYYTHKDVMKFLNKSDRTVRRLREDGKLGYSQPTARTYIYKKKDVDRLITKTYNAPFN